MEWWRCYLCGGRAIWGNDFTFEDYGAEGEGIVHTYTCSECGASYEVYEPIEERKERDQADDNQITFIDLGEINAKEI